LALFREMEKPSLKPEDAAFTEISMPVALLIW